MIHFLICITKCGRSRQLNEWPAKIRQRDLKQALIAARRAGAKELRLHLGDDVSMVIPLVPDDKPPESNGGVDL